MLGPYKYICSGYYHAFAEAIISKPSQTPHVVTLFHSILPYVWVLNLPVSIIHRQHNPAEYIFIFFFRFFIAEAVTSMVTLAAGVHDVGKIEFTGPLAHVLRYI